MHKCFKKVHSRRFAAACALAAAAFSVATMPACAGPHKVDIVNGTRTAMVALQLRTSAGGAWQADILKNRALGIQKQISVEVPADSSCFFDLKAMFEDGHRVTKSHVDLCKSPKYLLTNF